MASVLGLNSVFHDPSAAIVVDGVILGAIEEERLSRRKSRKKPVPFSNWEFPELAAKWCISNAGLRPQDIDAVAYSFDPQIMKETNADVSADYWEGLRQIYVEKTSHFIAKAIPQIAHVPITFVPHHTAHAASAYMCAPCASSAVLVLDGRGEVHSHLAGLVDAGDLTVLHQQLLPHSLGWLYEDLTEHLGFRRSADEYKVMGLAAYGRPRFINQLRRAVYATGDGGFVTERIDWSEFVEPRDPTANCQTIHADLASSVQRRLEEVALELVRWLHERTGETSLTLAGGTFLNCVLNSRIYNDGPFSSVWVQPAAGDAGTALGAALYVSRALDDKPSPMGSAYLGREFSSDELEGALNNALLEYERPADLVSEVAHALARNLVVGWFQGRSEFGPRALGSRSILAHPGYRDNIERLNSLKGREQFRPLAPMVLGEKVSEIFNDGPEVSPYMLFTHRARTRWRERIPAAVHVDGTSRIQTIDRRSQPVIARLLDEFEVLTGLPLLVNTSFNTADRPIVDSPRDALECFGSSPIDVLVLGDRLVRKPRAGAGAILDAPSQGTIRDDVLP